MNHIPLIGIFSLLLLSFACNGPQDEIASEQENLPLTERGSELAKSKNEDKAKAAQIALQVLDSMGGEKAWNNTRYISFVFFDRRRWYWDKFTNQYRVHFIEENRTVLGDADDSLNAKVYLGKKPLNSHDSIEKYSLDAYKAWINDTYWLIMPFKMLDSGVKLNYLGEANCFNGNEAEKLEMTFEDVGVTPKNKYHVLIDKQSKRVCSWTFYNDTAAKEPLFTTPWLGYRKYDNIYLSGNRGAASLTEIYVTDSLDQRIFEELNPLDSTQKNPS